jgi:hypothetical protein
MDLTNFKDLAAGIQSIAISVAVVIGGIWAIYRFLSLRELGRARVELKRLQRALAERATLNISLSAHPHTDPNGNGYYIEVAASVSNVGNRTEILNWLEGGIYTAPVIGQKMGNVIFGAWIETKRGGRTRRISSTLAPSEVTVFSFLVPIVKPGLYYVVFSVSGSPEERKELQREHERVAKEIGMINWGADIYVRVVEAERAENESAT